MSKVLKKDQSEEKWKDISGFEGKYQVSNLGNVRSLYKERYLGKYHRYINIFEITVLKPHDNGYGYNIVGLKIHNKRYSKYVHRLVAEAFIENPNNHPVVNHIDFNKKNNNVENLEWCTHKENVAHAKPKMRKFRNVQTNTGYKYVHFRKNRYIVQVKNICNKSFLTLEEALEYVKPIYEVMSEKK